jgi:hypothetical protein
MKSNYKNILKTIFVVSLSCFLALVLNFYSIQYSGENPLVSSAHGIDVIILITSIVFSVWFFKNFFNHGILHLWQGVFVGFGVLGFSLIFYSLFLYWEVSKDEKKLMIEYLLELKKNLEQNKKTILENMSEENYQKNMHLMLQSTPGDIVFHDIFQKMVASAFLPIFAVLFSSLAMRKTIKV